MKQVRMTRREILNPWLSRLSPEWREQVEKEIDKQERAIRDMKAGTKPRRTASRIIERSKARIGAIIEREFVRA
jgi:hypothetical protein